MGTQCRHTYMVKDKVLTQCRHMYIVKDEVPTQCRHTYMVKDEVPTQYRCTYMVKDEVPTQCSVHTWLNMRSHSLMAVWVCGVYVHRLHSSGTHTERLKIRSLHSAGIRTWLKTRSISRRMAPLVRCISFLSFRAYHRRSPLRICNSCCTQPFYSQQEVLYDHHRVQYCLFYGVLP